MKGIMPTIAEAIAHLKTYRGSTACAYALWTPPDVREVARQSKVKLTKDEVDAVLADVHRHHDCNNGITWDTLRFSLPS